MSNDGIQQLLQQQQKFTTELLQQQQRWMETILSSTQGTAAAPKFVDSAVPVFQCFNKEKQTWESYLQQLQQHFAAYSVSTPERQKSFFLSWCGAEIFELLKNLFGVSTLESQTFIELTEKLTNHFALSQHIIAARYEFHKRNMKSGQTYKEWIADLRGLSRQCKFICTSNTCSSSYVDEMIRDHIIVYTPHDAVRAAALQKQNATLADVVMIAETFEATRKTVEALKENSNEKTIEVNWVNKKKSYNKNIDKQPKFKSCSGCYSTHKREECRFKNAFCNKCGKKGHISHVCMSKNVKENMSDKVNNKFGKKQSNSIDVVDTIYDVTCDIRSTDSKSFISVEINNKMINFQMDSGASVSVINANTYKMLNKPKLLQTNRILYGFGKRRIPLLGELHTKIKIGNREKNVVLVVVDIDTGNNLFGFDLFKTFGFAITQVNVVTEEEHLQVNRLCEQFCEVFQPGLGTVKNFKANIRLKSSAQPKFFRSRTIPFAQMPKFKEEINRLVDQNIITPIKFSDWASPIVLAKKPNNAIRVCGDFKIAVNAQIDIEHYPLPTRENLFHTIRYGNYFSKIDLKDAYLQMELDDESKTIMVINTPLGLFQYQRLPYGIASAPAIFQKYIEQLLHGIDGVGNYLDDIIISAQNLQQHLERLEMVLKILQDNGIKCKREKCEFLRNELTYLGRKISNKGILPDESGVADVKNIKPPSDIKELEAFLGKVNYYHNFVPNFSSIAAPLNMLRRKNTPFCWGKQQQNSFEQLKSCIVNAAQLAHFREDLPITLATDASPFGIGAVISHIYPDGTERPIAFASKTLNEHQVRYSQIEKEGLAIVFGVQRFHQYLYGHKFTLITDHKPLVSIFNPEKHLPAMTAHRLQRWAITLMAYQYTIKYRRTTDHGNADALSRLPVGSYKSFDIEDSCNEITFDDFPLNIVTIREHAKKDKLLIRVKLLLQTGWPEKLDSTDADLKNFFNRRHNLTIFNDMLCLQTDYTRVVIPKSLQSQTLKLLHDGHWGITRMKQLARQFIWWDNIDIDITEMASKCDICKIQNAAPAREYQSWPKPSKPWERVHIDFAGPIFKSMWLVCVDSFSQFPYVSSMSNTTTEDTISALSAIFAIEGIPNTIVSDNGPQLTSEKFKEFCNTHGIKHVTTTPFHPASNGLAERFVRTFKTSVKKNLDDQLSINDAVRKFLATYRFMPNTDEKSPAELMRGRAVRTIWSQLLESSKKCYETPKSSSKYNIEDAVFVRNYGKGDKWVPGIVIQKHGKVIFVIKTAKGLCRRHINQMKPRIGKGFENTDFPIDTEFHPQPAPETSELVTKPESESNEEGTNVNQDHQRVRSSNRQRRPVHRYEPEDFR